MLGTPCRTHPSLSFPETEIVFKPYRDEDPEIVGRICNECQHLNNFSMNSLEVGSKVLALKGSIIIVYIPPFSLNFFILSYLVPR